MALLLGMALDHAIPPLFEITRDETLYHKLASAIPAALGAALMVAGVLNFRRWGTPVPGDRPARILVTTGVHAWSRNPIYLGTLLLYASIGLAIRSSWVLTLTPIVLLILRFAVVAWEEKYLESQFGLAYADYRSRVRRWL
jgi:protein-S-isoprenylcysteine O-methyltransferase Ste14